ncbi:MAG: hypothetical protein ACOX0H_03825 [Patescibacteria group bacterium]|jgi:hypothetical protein|nr:hypothetical protein [bacterium]HQC49929.1 hypothetical protein [bacterium]
MKKIFNKKTWSAWALILILAPIFIYGQLSSTYNYANAYNFQKDSGLDTTADEAGFETGPGADTVDNIISRVILTVLTWVGVIFFGFVIYGGFRWMIAEGNQERVKKAKNILTDALIGLIITLAAYAITFFIVGRLN